MLNILLDISEAESGMMQLNYKDIKIHGLVENVVDAYSLIADEKTIQLRIDGDNALTVMMDPDRMSQALANLLDNAIKYTPAGGEVGIRFYREESQIVIRFHDNGVGIDQEDISRIWDRLYRGRQSRTQRGLGLGLSQVKAIIEAHKGSIDAVTEIGKGSAFTIRIPASD